MLIDNIRALMILILAAACGAATAAAVESEGLSVLVGALVAVAADLYGRFNSEEDLPGAWALVHPDAGAHIWFIPVWVIGAIAAVFGVLLWTGVVS